MTPESESPSRVPAPLWEIGTYLSSEQAQRLLGDIAAVSAAVGGRFFDALVEYIGRRLGVDYVFVGALEPDRRHVRTRRIWFHDRMLDNLTYPIAGTPCETVLQHGFQAYPAGVQDCFPDDRYLMEQGVESYLGVPLTSTGGKVLGLISIMHRGSFNDVKIGETLLRIFAPRVAAEIERQHTQAALHESERMLAGVMSNLPGMVYRCRHDKDWTLEFVSDGSLALTGYHPDDLIDNRCISFLQMIHPDDLDNVAREIDAALKERRRFRLVYRLRTAQGEWRWVWEQGQGVFGPTGELVALEGLITDITEQWHTEQALRDSEARFRAIAENLVDGVITLDESGVIHSFNPAAERIFDYPVDEAVGKNLKQLMPESHRNRGDEYLRHNHEGHPAGIVGVGPRELSGLRRDGTVFPMELSVGPMDISGRRMYVGIVRDITERVRTRERLHRLAHYDALTNLPNRTLFTDRLDQVLRRADRERRNVALLFLDLDGFKAINDTLGHDAGDRVLQAVAERLKTCVRDSDSVARLAGDEFAVLLENVALADDARRISEKILGVLSGAIHVDSSAVRVTCSIGIGLYPDDIMPASGDEAPTLLLHHADIAMYCAKQRGPNRYEFYASRA